jgi:hypothetical protein
MIFGLFVMITALTISAVAIYYSVSGLVAIFAAAAIPIIVMGTALEVGKLVTAVWLHWYWKQARWWLKTYLSIAVLVLMFITSMGIFGFLSKAHIEQTSAAEEGIAQIERIEQEIIRTEDLIRRAQTRIEEAEASVGAGNDATQAQIDKEQERIDSAYIRIEPAIAEQNKIIQTQLASLEDKVGVYEEEIKSLDSELERLKNLVQQYRTQIENTSVASIEEQIQPYKDQIAQLDADLERINKQANEYEQRITNLQIDNSAIESVKSRVAAIEENIVVVTNKLQSTEREKIKEGQAVIGVTSDGLFGGNTTRAYNAWLEAQRARISELQAQETELRTQAQATLDAERTRLTNQVKELRGTQTDNINQRKQSLLNAIDSIRANAVDEAKTQRAEIQTKIDTVLDIDIPANRDARQSAQDAITALRQADDMRINAARQTIKDLRAGAETQIAASNDLIQRLRNSLTVGKDQNVEALVNAQQQKIVEFNNNIDNLTEEKYALQAEYRKLEAEVGPIKYLAEFIYGETDKDILEEAVRWVIITIIFVFDPLAVLLLIASQATFEMHKRKRSVAAAEGDNNEIFTSNTFDVEPPQFGESNNETDIVEREQDSDNRGEDSTSTDAELRDNDRTEVGGGSIAERVLAPEQEARRQEVEEKEANDIVYKESKRRWKMEHPNEKIKDFKEDYIMGNIDKLPWDTSFIARDEKGKQYTGYTQNSEQNDRSIWKKIGTDDQN